MRAMTLEAPGRPLTLRELPTPEPGPGELLLRIEACGVCRTDLHLVDGELPPRRERLIPGHEIIGRVIRLGPNAHRFPIGARVGTGWLRATCGRCRFCRRGDENLCLTPRFTGWDENGGYAEETVVPESFAYPLPESPPAHELAPLLCAGIIGYRAYRCSNLRPGGRLGLYGFGGSAHVTIQLARHFGSEVYVFTRQHRELAEALGATWVGTSRERPPVPLDAAILFAPAGELVPVALETLDRGGTLAVAGIHLSPLPPLDYARHLFQERTLRSVTANTRDDAREFLALAQEIPIRTETRRYPLEAANDALKALKAGEIRGAAVLEPFAS